MALRHTEICIQMIIIGIIVMSVSYLYKKIVKGTLSLNSSHIITFA